MRRLRLLLLLGLVVAGLSLAQNNPSTTAPAGAPQSPSAMATSVLLPSPVTILTPAAGQTLPDNFVHLRFELNRPAPSGEPIFLVQLDDHDPISMTDTDYTFPYLSPGSHIIRVTLVDANHLPIEGPAATVQFKVPSQPQPAPGSGSSGAMLNATGDIAGAAPPPPIPPELRNAGDINLPLTDSPLPLLSVIGFCLLIGAAAHALRSPKNPTRRAAL